MKTYHESDEYPTVEKWIKRHFLCFKTGVDTGSGYGRIDVVGVRDIGGDLTGDVETMAVEVKKPGSPFATTSGQTLGYRIYANRVYLAESRKKPFTPEEIDIASHLGIGLIQIRQGKCSEIRSSPFYSPMVRLNLLLLDQLGLGRCQLCGCFFETGGRKRNYREVTAGDNNVQRAIEKGKGLIFWNYDTRAETKHKLGVKLTPGTTYERRFICPECVQNLLGIQPKRLDSWFSDYKRKP